MTSKLYSSVRSPHCLKVAMFLQEKGIEFERIEIDLPARQQKIPAYLQINPFGLVPAYVDDYGPHLDSLGIMHYLEWRYPTPKLFPEMDQLPEALAWIARSSSQYRDVSHYLYWQLIEPPASGINQQRVDELMHEGKQLLQTLEEKLENASFLFGDFGVVDIAFIPWVHGYHRFEGLLTVDEFPKVYDWVERVSQRPAYQDNYQKKGIPFSESA